MPSDVAGLGTLALGLFVFITVLWTNCSVSEPQFVPGVFALL